jgi:hypothetical protein
VLAGRLSALHGNARFPFASRYRIGDLTGVRHYALANYSLPDEVRWPEAPNFMEHQPFLYEVKAALVEAYKQTKRTLAERRR